MATYDLLDKRISEAQSWFSSCEEQLHPLRVPENEPPVIQPKSLLASTLTELNPIHTVTGIPTKQEVTTDTHNVAKHTAHAKKPQHLWQ
jgi:hypothetical protein